MSNRNQASHRGTRELLLSVARCTEIPKALADDAHPCHKVVCVQQQGSLQHFQLPEPWNGAIEHAPLLFVSSNPGYGPHECYPTGDEQAWPDELIVDFFVHRFGGGQSEWLRNGNRALQADGAYPGREGQNFFWPRTKRIAGDIFGRDVVAGRDYAITEVVHCKSAEAIGVNEAGRHCATLHLGRALAASPANVVVVFGGKAKPIVQGMYPETGRRFLDTNGSTELTPALPIAGRNRHVVFHQHPGGGLRYLSRCLPDSLETVRAALDRTRSL